MDQGWGRSERRSGHVLLLNDRLPYVELVGFCEDGWDVEVTVGILQKFLLAVLLKIAIVEAVQIDFYIVVDQVVDAKDGSRTLQM